MPFITIELPDRLHFSFKEFAVAMHHYLASRLNVPIELFKTKLVRLPETIVGDGANGHCYARLRIELKAGRDRGMLGDSQKELLERFSHALQKENPGLSCIRITVEFSELDPAPLVSQALSNGP